MSEELPPRAAFGDAFAMPLDRFFDALAGGGVSTMLNEQDIEIARAKEQVAALAAKLVTDPEWRPLVEWLLDISLRRPTVTMHLAGNRDMRDFHSNFREGQNSIVFLLLREAAVGRKERPPTREGL